MSIFIAMLFCTGVSCARDGIQLLSIHRSLDQCETASLDFGFQYTGDGFVLDGPVAGDKFLMHGHEINPRTIYAVCMELRLQSTSEAK